MFSPRHFTLSSAPPAPVLALEAMENQALAVLESGDVVRWSFGASPEEDAECKACYEAKGAQDMAVSLVVPPSLSGKNKLFAVGLEEGGLMLLRQSRATGGATILMRYAVDFGSVTAGAFLPHRGEQVNGRTFLLLRLRLTDPSREHRAPLVSRSPTCAVPTTFDRASGVRRERRRPSSGSRT
jgi:hypothetical protein